jgi:hypothetical protein
MTSAASAAAPVSLLRSIVGRYAHQRSSPIGEITDAVAGFTAGTLRRSRIRAPGAHGTIGLRQETSDQGVAIMKKLIAFLVIAVAAIVFAASASARATSTITVVMKDPGCHWFSVAGKLKTKLAVTGPIWLFNTDEAALKVAGPHGVKLEPVGKKLALAKSTYHITMVGQAPDDNHLLLVVK